MDNRSTHDDDAAIIRASAFIANDMDDNSAASIDLVRDLMNRVLEKKVELRGAEGQVRTLQAKVEGLEKILVGD